MLLGEEEIPRRGLGLGASPSWPGVDPKRALGVRDKTVNLLQSG